MSFAFSVRPNGDSWGQDDDGNDVRTLTNVRLYDVSPVTYPAYTETDVAVRSFNDWKKTQEKPDYSLERRKLDLLEVDV